MLCKIQTTSDITISYSQYHWECSAATQAFSFQNSFTALSVRPRLTTTFLISSTILFGLGCLLRYAFSIASSVFVSHWSLVILWCCLNNGILCCIYVYIIKYKKLRSSYTAIFINFRQFKIGRSYWYIYVRLWACEALITIINL